MTIIPESKTLRDLIGKVLQKNKLMMVMLLILIASITIFDIVPREWGIPVSLVFVWLIFWLIRGRWSDLGFRSPYSWVRTIAIGVSVAIISQAIVALILLPLFNKLGIGTPDYSSFDAVKGNVGALIFMLTISWTTAGFGEEILNRGFFMEQFAKLFGGKLGWTLSLILVSVIFGLGHTYQGPIGMLLTAYSGLVYGLLYILSGRNLWHTIIAHGTADTIAFLALYTGLMEKLL